MNNTESTLSGVALIFNISGQTVLRRRFSEISPIHPYVKILPHCGFTFLLGIRIYTTWGSLHISFNLADQLVFEDFFLKSIFFYYFLIISPLSRAWRFIWTNLYYLGPEILCAKLSWKWSSGYGKNEKCQKSMSSTLTTTPATRVNGQILI